MANWKNAERQVAKVIGGKRHSRGANFGEEAPDIIMPKDSLFVYEVKYRKKISNFLKDGLLQAKRYAKDNQVPVLVLKERYMHGALVVLNLRDWKDLHG